jgi:hypothetical protein
MGQRTGRHTPYFDPESALTTQEVVFIQNLSSEANYDSTKVVLVSHGAGAPSSTPTAIGELYVDTTNNVLYFATGTTNSSDWEATTGGGGGGVTVEIPAGTIDSSNTAFTVSATPKWIVSDGITYFNGAGYSITGLNITMELPPSGYLRAII